MADTVAEVAESFAADMEEYADEVTDEDNIKRALRAGAEVFMEHGQANVRAQGLERTGRLAEEWEIRDFSDRKGRPHLRAGPNAFYGLFHEIGAGDQTATPFLRPAFDEHIDEIAEAIRSELAEVAD